MSGTESITATQLDGMDGNAAAPITSDAAPDTNNQVDESALKDNNAIAVNEVANDNIAGNLSLLNDDVKVSGIELPYSSTYADELIPSSKLKPATGLELLLELAAIIKSETEKFEAYLRENNIPGPTFEPDGHADLPRLSESAQRSRQEIIRATQELKDLMVGPTESMRWLAWDHNNQLSMQAVNQFKIALTFPVGSTATYGQIAAKVGIDEMNVRRFLRHAMTNRIFKEVSPGVVAHTAASKVIAEEKSMQDWLGFCTEDMSPAAAFTIQAMQKFPGSQENNECGFQVAFGTNEPMFATLGKDPIRGKRFGGAMASLTGGEGYEVQYFIDNYDMSDLNNIPGGTFVDIGGSHGFVCVDLAKRYENMNFVVQDLPKMIASAPTPEGKLGERIKFEGYDFYTPQTAKGADVYFFRWIFHNQSDKYAIEILRNLIPALKKGASIVINDHCLPEPGTESLWDEKIIRTMDLVMLTLLNAQERSATEFRALFAAASPGFRFIGVTRPKGCRMSIIEAVWEGEDYEREDNGVELPTPVDTPLVTPVEAKTDLDKSLPLVSTTKDESRAEPKIEGSETALEHDESSVADTKPEVADAATEKIKAMILNSDIVETSKAPELSPFANSANTHHTSSSAVA